MNANRVVDLARPLFSVSLDLELIWGTRDLFGPERFRRACEIERAEVIGRLLDLLEEFRIPATWCVVGHLFLDRCEPRGGVKHPEIVPPAHRWRRSDWFDDDPCSDEAHAPVFYGRSLVEKIRRCPMPQEIGSHSFSHAIFGDPGCSRETAESELAASKRAARGMGIELRSFVFPRNSVGHLETLREHGFLCYRGPEPTWYERAALPDSLKRLAHLAGVVSASEPPVVFPESADGQIWNIPGSMIYFPMHGARRYVPLSQRVRRAQRGLAAAVRKKGIFHLWFHPTNLAEETDVMFSGLRQIFEHAAKLRATHGLDVLPMGGIAELASAAAAA